MPLKPVLIIERRDDILKNFGNQIGALGAGEAHAALARAVNRVTKTVEGRVVRVIAKQSSIKTSTIRGAIRTQQVKPGSSQALEGKIIATGRPISLKEFGAKQFSFGVRARVWGRVERFPGMFIFGGTYRSGIPVGHGHVFYRTGGYSKKSDRDNAIDKKTGPSVPEEMVRDESARVFNATVQTMLPVRVAHEIGRLLPGAR
jgi:hypothetical protein